MIITEELARKVREIEIVARRMANDAMAGEYHSVFKGRGMEFSEVRPYTHGDDARSIDWNVTARSGYPHIKRFVEERELTVILAVDASGSLEFGTRKEMKGELAAEVCALLAFAAIRNNDRVGLAIFSEDVELYVPPRKGRRHVLRIIRELLYFRPAKRGTNIKGALEYMRRILTRRAVVFLVSDFLEDNLEQPLSAFARRHDLVTIGARDRREETLPNVGLIELEDAETGQRMIVDTSSRAVRREFERQAVERREALSKTMSKLDLDFVQLETGEDYLPPLIKLFRLRARRT
jgi:uncharacterized protein (DUF58 family)